MIEMVTRCFIIEYTENYKVIKINNMTMRLKRCTAFLMSFKLHWKLQVVELDFVYYSTKESIRFGINFYLMVYHPNIVLGFGNMTGLYMSFLTDRILFFTLSMLEFLKVQQQSSHRSSSFFHLKTYPADCTPLIVPSMLDLVSQILYLRIYQSFWSEVTKIWSYQIDQLKTQFSLQKCRV